MENKRDLSISMARTNVIVSIGTIPVGLAQLMLFVLIHGIDNVFRIGNLTMLVLAVLVGIPIHELIHALGFVIFGRKPFSVIKLGIQWKTLTPYAHLKEPLEVNAYRIATFMPGLILGMLPYLLSLLTGNSDLFWFSLVHLLAAGGDWLILWLIRNVRKGSLVEDHPTNAGCYVLEP
jgi:hypothetical protein